MTQPITAANGAAAAEPLGYRPISVRLAEFRRDFPLHCMYQLVRTQRLSELQLCNAEGVPLPCVEFTCALRHFETTYASASTLIPIEGNKSWEAGETNALSRLLELLGYGRELTDADEAEQQRIMEDIRKGKGVRGARQLAAVPAAASQSAATPAAGSTTSIAVAATETKATNDSKFQSREPAAKPNAAKGTAISVDELGIRLSVKNAVVQRAKLQGKPVPEFKSVEEFEAFRLEVFGAHGNTNNPVGGGAAS